MQVLASLAQGIRLRPRHAVERARPAKQRDHPARHRAASRSPLTFKDGRKEYTVNKPFEGVIGNLNRRMLQTESAWMREELGKFQTAQPCETCHGKRLKPEGAGGEGRRRRTSPPRRAMQRRRRARPGSSRCPTQLSDTQNQIARAILKEINERLGFLDNVGLDYLNLDRTSGTLSGGESQRIRLASQIGSGPVGRALRARRAEHRPPPARQRPAARNAQAPARPRQHGDRRRA